MNYYLLIFRNLLRNRRRTFLTLLGVMISFLLFVAIFTLLENFNKFLKSNQALTNLWFQPTYMKDFLEGQLPEAYLHQLQKIPLVKFMTPYKVYLGTGRKEEEPLVAIGVYPRMFPHLRKLNGVTPPQLEEFATERKAALVGQEVMKKNQWKLGDDVSLRGMRSLNDLSIHIVGVMGQNSDLPDVIAVQYEYLKEHMKDGGVFSVALLQVEDPYQVPWLREVVEERFQNSMVPVEVITEKGFIESLLGEYSSMVDAIRWIAWITLLATLFVLGNTMAMSIRERSVDQGVLRTLGFSRARVFWLYLSESILLSTFGGLLGGAIGCYIFYQWEIVLPGSPGVQGLLLEPFWNLLKPVALLSILMGVFSGLPPAFFAARKKITDTLRFVA